MVPREQVLGEYQNYETLSAEKKKSLIAALSELPDDAVLMVRSDADYDGSDYDNRKIEIFCSRKELETDEEYDLRLKKHDRNLARYRRELERFVKKSAEWEAWFQANKEAIEREERSLKAKELSRLQKQADRARQQLFEAETALKELGSLSSENQ